MRLKNTLGGWLLLAGSGLVWYGTGLAQQAEPLVPNVPKIPKLSAEEWRKLYPFKSIEERLEFESRRAKADKPPVLSPETVKRLDDIDRMEKNPLPWGRHVRVKSLEMLHSKEVEDFIKRDGFGVTRVPTPSVRYLSLPPAPSFPFDSVSYKPSDLSGEPKVSLPRTEKEATAGRGLPSSEALSRFHDLGEAFFLDPNSFGLVKDRRNVAGFEPHQFRIKPSMDYVRSRPKDEPKNPERWALHRLELVSLLKHEKPAVYVSKTLPRMEDLKKTETRALSAFEDAGLKRLKEGRDVVTESTTNRIQMMGALRANAQCLKCHNAQRGELLGVFSYELVRDPPIRVQ